MPYFPPVSSGSIQLPEYTSDPASPTAGQAWISAAGSAGTAGQAMGVMGLTYSRTEVDQYYFNIQTIKDGTKGVNLNG
jgi:hypothetical protein